MFSSWMRGYAPGISGWSHFTSSVNELTNFYDVTVKNHKKTHDSLRPRDLIDTFITEIEKCKDCDSPFYQEIGYTNLHAVIGDTFQGGSRTTPHTLEWTLLYLTAHAEVQGKLQVEIDSVVGKLRKPSLFDRPKMPYTEAVVSEVLRKSSLPPLGACHRAHFDAEFHGFRIRKGTEICRNIYSAHHNPNYWDQPDVFKPERFLTPHGLELIKKPDAFNPFQAGRRQCLGEQLAKDTLFLFVTSIYQTFTTLPNRSSPKLDLEPIPGFSLLPKPFNILLNEWN